ncbi:molybdopterin oxidoreductase family protein [Streptomyces europaeiscabiei]|uniref:Molybdopterin oxidoreductase family protein n=2 Tax=Streptomyces europaeiscabiei TaxID=146819 RepID=A0ABU4NR84_9ACTN|nr:molybdopterin oxidoreductase family protein [Streptomyces europaeiscabiei]MDX3547844.1 molybdopterin oxidoreductase family protein [Streptomyces europaeiscabiei]MDX3557713.1 molybdopterin oxidoreductase family protein [Streptomyces europaeiscabiei]MDX3668579.1 molybdopterin oxidoreductase family protein [Streptomyces europaeiscabiei]MDX3705481.1 molybdopterin oxidoreductase family protein [Streptomyces europaeiscabiei]MDX3783276.1 molybdopterin oxidoreductase family protein [Streptomyces eu
MSTTIDSRTALRVCPLCEATCGLTLTIEGTRVTKARGDRDDVFSKGFICPKGASLGAADGDPDRLRTPLVRRDGELREATWQEAFDAVAAGLRPVVETHGPNAVGLVFGNPNVHTVAGGLYPPLLVGGLGTRSMFSASTVDQMPKHVSSGLLFGDANAIPVPDLDRTDHLLLLGANPLESNGSLCTAPDFPGKLKALKARGGTLTVVDPRLTRTAKLADRHVAIRPGTDALLLAAMAYVLFEEHLVDLGDLAPHVQGVEELAATVREFTPEAVAGACDVDAGTIRALARELAAAPTAAVYGRIGSCTVPHGTLASWLVDVLNILTGNLDRPGGALFPQSATDRTPRPAGPGHGFALGRWRSRVSGHPEAKGELPLSALAEEIDTATPEGSPIRALVTVAANPVLSAPDGDRLDKALDSLDFMVSVDPYLGETARHADVVLPPPPPSQAPHYDFALNTLAVRNQVRYNRAAVPLEDGRMSETEILARLVLAATGMHGADPSAVDDLVIGQTLGKAVKETHSPVHGRDPKELAGRLTGTGGPERRLDMMLRLGPYGDGFGADPDGLTLAKLLAHPHGIDLGPLKPRLPQPLKTVSGRIELLPQPIVDDLPRLRSALRERPDGLVLIGRRHLRSNNSWLHNIPALTGGTNRCTLHIHPDDASRLGLADGDDVRIKGAGGEVTAPVEVTDVVRRGVVSLPHGWGHDRPGTRMSHAAIDPGVNVNQLLDGSLLDPLSGNAVLNGIPVDLARAGATL